MCIHHLCMKFPTKEGIATVQCDQMSSRECYLSSLRIYEPRSINMVLLDTKMADAPEEGLTPEQGETSA